jgi:broad specificity phosphatase PhoE
MRRLAVLTCLAVLAAPLSACGGGDGTDGADSAYCSTLKDERRTLERLADEAAQPGKDVLTPTLQALARLRKAAPEDLQDEWDTLYYAWSAMVDAVRRAGVDPADYRPGQTPDGVSAADSRRLAEVASQLSSGRVVDASRGVEDQARQVCGVELRV